MREPEEDENGELETAKIYEPIPDLDFVRQRAYQYLQQYNEENPSKQMFLVLFDDALMHLMVIARILQVYQYVYIYIYIYITYMDSERILIMAIPALSNISSIRRVEQHIIYPPDCVGLHFNTSKPIFGLSDVKSFSIYDILFRCVRFHPSSHSHELDDGHTIDRPALWTNRAVFGHGMYCRRSNGSLAKAGFLILHVHNVTTGL